MSWAKMWRTFTCRARATEDGTGNTLNNWLVGNGNANSLSGLAGNDTLYGYAGNDSLNGGTGTFILTGGNGVNPFAVRHSSDFLNGTGGSGK